jgi:hypothetical protein
METVGLLNVPRHLCLGELIDRLEGQNPDTVIRYGFTEPHSYRGDYSELAFEPAENVRVGDMLMAARAALGATFQGWKGGDYTMADYTSCWLAVCGDTGESIGSVLLERLLADVVEPASG